MNKVRTTPLCLLLIAFLINACRKDIDIPNSEASNIFGEWEWVGSSGGFSGTTINPTSEGYTETISFTRKGIFKKFSNGKRENKHKFTLIEGASIYSSENTNIVKYAVMGLSKKGIVSDSYYFNTPDTLVLRDECYDCYMHTYVRIR